MKIKVVNTVIAIIISGLLAWWLGTMGIYPMQKWLLGALGGLIVLIGLIGSMGLNFKHSRSGSQVKIVLSGIAVIGFVASSIYSFFMFSAIGYCVPMGIFLVLGLFLAYRIYKTEM